MAAPADKRSRTPPLPGNTDATISAKRRVHTHTSTRRERPTRHPGPLWPTGRRRTAALPADDTRYELPLLLSAVDITPKDDSETFTREWAGGHDPGDYLVSVTIEAREPDTGGCNKLTYSTTPGWRILLRTYSHQYE